MKLLAAISLMLGTVALADDAPTVVVVLPPVATASTPVAVAPVRLGADVPLPRAPKALAASVHRLSVEQVAALRATLSRLPAEKMKAARVQLFLADIETWARVSQLIQADENPGPRFGINWIDAARAKLRKRIEREGYTPAILKDAEVLMRRVTDSK